MINNLAVLFTVYCVYKHVRRRPFAMNANT